MVLLFFTTHHYNLYETLRRRRKRQTARCRIITGTRWSLIRRRREKKKKMRAVSCTRNTIWEKLLFASPLLALPFGRADEYAAAAAAAASPGDVIISGPGTRHVLLCLPPADPIPDVVSRSATRRTLYARYVSLVKCLRKTTGARAFKRVHSVEKTLWISSARKAF